MDRFDEQELLKQYLLGTLPDELVRSQIEKRSLADEEYAEQIDAAEDDLIEKFLDGELTGDESDRFNKFFLAPPERRRQLRLTEGLRRLSVQSALTTPRRQRSLTWRISSREWLRLSFAAIVIIAAAVSIWRFVIYRSDTDKGIEQLQAAYRDQRPVESRTAELGVYAPYTATRGSKTDISDPAALDRADKYLLDATANPKDAEAHRARAIYYVATRDFERAVREIDTAIKVSPNDARVQSDAGSVYYEAAKNAGNSADQLKLLDKSLEHLQRAIELEPKLLEPRFNRALCLESLTDFEQAKAAWNDYLKLDPDSRWSDEAKRHLQQLQQAAPADRSADQLESDFLAAYHLDNREEAEKLIHESPEAINEKYLPQRLSMSLATAEPDRRNELLGALKYVADIESADQGDGYANDIAHFYASIDDNTLALVQNAQRAIRDGYTHCKANEYSRCLASFQAARDLFKKAGDEPEAQLAEYFVGYAQANTENHAAALATITGVADYARSHGYKWMEMTATYWVGGCLAALKKHTEALATYERVLAMAREANDSYATDRNLTALAEGESDARQDSDALRYTFASLQLSSAPSTSSRQRYRDLSIALPVLSRAGLPHVARFVGLESVAIADVQKNPMWMAQSRGYTSVAFQESGDLAGAEALLEESRSVAGSISDEQTRRKVIAFAALRSGDVEYAAGNYEAAHQFYSDAASVYDSGIEIPVNRDEAHLGVLQTDLVLHKTDELEAQIPINIQLAEESRFGILDESQRTGFFDSRVNIYDIASEFELSRGNATAAYDHAEMSSARSLLDHMLSGLDTASSSNGQQLLLRGNAAPMALDEIRAKVPANAQIIQYSVFRNKLVIWLLSREDFSFVVEPLSSKDLGKKVSEYASLVSQPNSDPAQEQAASRELYDLLIAPVKDRLAAGRDLCIVPSRVLFELPFAALVAPDGERLIKKFSIVYSPSANVFVSATMLAAQKTDNGLAESILAVGDPAFDRTQHSGLQPLGDAAIESQKISKMYGRESRSLIKAAATKSAFLDGVETADIIHFAGHYVAQSASPMSSYLLFAASGQKTDGDKLTDLELARMTLRRTRLVVLAACDSGAETWYDGEGMIGAARSMLAAGAPLVVASQWAVDSRATSELMIRFHQLRRQQHHPSVAALREAQIALIDDRSLGYTSPYYWAGFAMFGGAANF